MWPPAPPVEAERGPTISLPLILWGSLLGLLLILAVAGAVILYCCWLSPRRYNYYIRKHRCQWPPPQPSGAQPTAVIAGPWGPNSCVVQTSIVRDGFGGPPRPIVNTRPMSEHIQPALPSLWRHCPLYASSSVLDEVINNQNNPDGDLRTRSLPSWGKLKQRPLSTTDDLEELYAKVNFSKKRRNRMRNDEAAVIALSRSRSQCLAGGPLSTHPVQISESEAVVVYDERTAL